MEKVHGSGDAAVKDESRSLVRKASAVEFKEGVVTT